MPTGHDLAEIRARAERHQQELDKDTRFYTVADLAARWRCSPTTVRRKPRTALPWINLGNGLVREDRRYTEEAVLAYETAQLAHARERSA